MEEKNQSGFKLTLNNSNIFINNNNNESSIYINNNNHKSNSSLNFVDKLEKNSSNSNIKRINNHTKSNSLQFQPSMGSLNQSQDIFINNSQDQLTQDEYGKILYNSIRANQEYLKRVDTLQNRINKLVEHENEVFKKAEGIKKQVIKEEQIKVIRIKDKKALEKAKYEEFLKQEYKKKLVTQEKEKREKILNEKKEILLRKNKESYMVMKNDRNIIDALTSQVKSHYKNLNSFNSLRVKETENRAKSTKIEVQKKREMYSRERIVSRFKEQEELHDALMRKIQQLEEIENKCVKNLNKTIRAKAAEVQMFKQRVKTESEMLNRDAKRTISQSKKSLNTSSASLKNVNIPATKNKKPIIQYDNEGRK